MTPSETDRALTTYLKDIEQELMGSDATSHATAHAAAIVGWNGRRAELAARLGVGSADDLVELSEMAARACAGGNTAFAVLLSLVAELAAMDVGTGHIVPVIISMRDSVRRAAARNAPPKHPSKGRPKQSRAKAKK